MSAPWAPVVLVNMPWAEYFRPSLQLGLIQALLQRNGIGCSTYYAMIDYAELVGSDLYRASEDLYRPHLEWVFSAAAFGRPQSDENAFFSDLRNQGASDAEIDVLRGLHAQVDSFLDGALSNLLAGSARVIGFGTSMLQTLPAVALAARIKRRRPDLVLVFGGATCKGTSGRALMRVFPCIDLIVADQCDAWVSELFHRLLSDRPLDDLYGILWRRRGEIVVNPPSPRFDDLDDNPVPDYTDFFTRMARSPLFGRELPSIPFEGSRGCWWGRRNHCRFCGLNGQTLEFRKRSAGRLVAELAEQRKRHNVDVFIASDEIMPLAYLDELPDKLRSDLPDATIFWEMKPLVRREQLAALASACRLGTQPGLEHLSTRLLELMHKGSTGSANIAILRRAVELNINIWWNLLYDVPGERLDDYAELVARFWMLFHLQPPFLFPITLTRYSPYHEEPARHGIRILGPQRGLEHAYPVAPELREDLALAFDFEHTNGYDVQPVATMLNEALSAWEQLHPAAELRVTLDADRALVVDSRCGRECRYHLDPATTAVYRCLESPHKLPGLRRALLRSNGVAYLRLGAQAGLRSALRGLERAGLVWRDGERVVALAVPEGSGFWIE
jgi:ribosomal peptide maturation radical SAM protein 1